MTFTFTNYAGMKVPRSPMNAMIQNAMDIYNKGTQTEFLRPQLQADLIKKQINNEFLRPNLQANLDKQLLSNKFYPENIQSEIGLRNAQKGLANEQSKYYGPNIQSQMSSRAIQQQLANAQMMKALSDTQKTNMILQDINGNPSNVSLNEEQTNNSNYQPIGYDFNNSENPNAKEIAQKISNSPSDEAWGVKIPQPTKEDKRNKLLYGMDTYSSNLNQARENQNIQQKGYITRMQQLNNQADSVNHFDQLLDRYNNLMDKTLFSGRLHKTPFTTENQQEINNTTQEMGKFGVESLRNAMQNARFTNLDMTLAQKLKPDITWSPGARKFFTNFSKGIKERMNEKAAFYQVASNPKMNINFNLADRLWSSYQDTHPLVKSDTNKELHHYRKDNWMSFLTPEAIKSVEEKGYYKPKDIGYLPTREEINAELKRRQKKDNSL